jgi:hypothetical protein
MRGVITSSDVLWHSWTIIRCWGPRCYLRCVRAALSSRRSTFLEVACSPERPGGGAASPHPRSPSRA